MAKERLQKILSHAGVCSRRQAEVLIREGSVRVNGEVAAIGDRALFGKDAIKVNGKLLHHAPNPLYYGFYKPKGVLSVMHKDNTLPTLSDYVNLKDRLYPIGRLDFNSEGILILTNDGTFTEKVQKNTSLTRLFHVKVRGNHVEDKYLDSLAAGGMLDRMIRPVSVSVVERLANKSVIAFTLKGKGAIDVRAYFELKGFLVEKVTRMTMGPVSIAKRQPGELWPLKPNDISLLS